MEKTKPNVIVVGGYRCGTTYFANFIRQHPEVYVNEKKEINFFGKHIYTQVYTRCNPIFQRGFYYYLDFFKPKNNEKIIMDVSPFTALDLTSANDIKKYLPNVKIIFLIREKEFQRKSVYNHLLGSGNLRNVSYEEYKKQYPNYYYGYSDYNKMVSPFIKEFGNNNVLKIPIEELRDNDPQVVERLLNFLNIKPFNFHQKGITLEDNKTTLKASYKLFKRINRILSMFSLWLGLKYYTLIYRNGLKHGGENENTNKTTTTN